MQSLAMKASTTLRAMLHPASFPSCIPRWTNSSTRSAITFCPLAFLRLKGKQGSRVQKTLGFCSSLSSFSSVSTPERRSVLLPERGDCRSCGKTRMQSGSYGERETGRGATLVWQHSGSCSAPGARKLWTFAPLQMGRRSAKIATKKGAQDKKKAKLYGKIGKQIVAAVKDGGPNPTSNPALAALLQMAKEYNIPKEIVDRNIKKARDKNQEDFVELTYEVYGFGGVGIVLEVLTDNNNRAAANIRDVVKKSGGKMAEKGSVLFNFKRAGVITVKPSEISGDEILLAAMDAGAEDVIEPSAEDEDDDEEGEKNFKVLTPVDQYGTISQKLKDAGVTIDTDNSGLELFPIATVKPDDEAEELNRAMMEKLLDLDDVDAVSSTQG